MNSFLTDLKRAVDESAKTLRKNVVSEDADRRYREQRQEAQFVSEVYYNFRNNGYKSKSLFMEYSYPSVETEGKKKRLKPDLIFERDGNDHVVEFKVFWEDDIKKNSSKIREGQKKYNLNKILQKNVTVFSLAGSGKKMLILGFCISWAIKNGKWNSF